MGDISIKGSNKSILRGPHGFGPKPFLNKPGQAQGTHGGKARGGRIGLKHGKQVKRNGPVRPINIPWSKPGEIPTKKAIGGPIKALKIAARKLRKPKPHRDRPPSRTHKDVPTMAAEGGRIGFRHGKGPHGFGPKPYLHKPGVGPHGQPGGRKSKAVGGAIAKGIGTLVKKFKKKKKVYPETESLVHQKGPYVGDVGSEGKRAGPRAGRPKSSQPKRPWAGTPPGRKRKWAPPIGKFPPEKRKSKPPLGKFPPEKGKWQKVAEGGRIGFKKGTDKKWMQKVSASIKKRGTKGKCTPITKPGCTGRAKALAKTFKKIAAKRKA